MYSDQNCLSQSLFIIKISNSHMSDYAKILQVFTKFGLTVSTKIKQADIKRTLNAICKANSNLHQFDDDVACQLWEHTIKTQSNSEAALLKDYIQTMIDAREILRENISKCESKQLNQQSDKISIIELKQSLESYREDYEMLTELFQLSKQSQYASPQKQKDEQNKKRSLMPVQSQIFASSPSQREQSTSLKVVFLLGVALLFSDMLTLFVKQHFYCILSNLAVFSIFFLNYFDATFIRFCILLGGVSALMDIVWIFAKLQTFWNSNILKEHSNLQNGFSKCIVVLVTINIAARLFQSMLLYRYRNNDSKSKRRITICGKNWEVQGKIRSDSWIMLGNRKQPVIDDIEG